MRMALYYENKYKNKFIRISARNEITFPPPTLFLFPSPGSQHFIIPINLHQVWAARQRVHPTG